MKREFLQLVMLLTVVCMIFAGATIIVGLDNKSVELTQSNHELESQEPISDVEELNPETIEEKAVPDNITGLLIGFDVSGKLTDVMMVGHMDTVKNQVDIISIPRDLLIDFSEDELKDVKKNNPNNHLAYCKLNEVYNNVGADDRALKDVQEIIEIITGLRIDYMVRIDTNGFKELVDAVDGVEFDVPERMKYNDPAQDLHIDLQPGLQLLDGDKAEQLVRYRHYSMGDLRRIQVQQEFMTEFYKKVLSIQDFGQVKDLVSSAYDMVKADFGLLFIQQYAEYIFDLKMEDLLNPEHMATVPSYGEKINEIWYQTWSKEETNAVVDEIINN